VEFTQGGHDEEISWEIHLSGTSFMPLYWGEASNTSISLEAGVTYDFVKYDSYGDGWNDAYYTVTVGGQTVANGTLSNGFEGVDTFSTPASCF
jgi:hypothetical protein